MGNQKTKTNYFLIYYIMFSFIENNKKLISSFIKNDFQGFDSPSSTVDDSVEDTLSDLQVFKELIKDWKLDWVEAKFINDNIINITY